MQDQRVAASLDNQSDETLIDTLIAISVVAKRLAEKLRQEKDNNSYKEKNHEQESKCYWCAR